MGASSMFSNIDVLFQLFILLPGYGERIQFAYQEKY